MEGREVEERELTKRVVGGSVAGALSIVALVAGITFGTMHSNEEQTKQIEACAEAGGTYIYSTRLKECFPGGVVSE